MMVKKVDCSNLMIEEELSSFKLGVKKKVGTKSVPKKHRTIAYFSIANKNARGELANIFAYLENRYEKRTHLVLIIPVERTQFPTMLSFLHNIQHTLLLHRTRY